AFKLRVYDPPNPALAERHFGRGAHLFWQRNYAAAEREFDEALRYFPSDARYLWFLGLARYQQGKSSYHEDFRQAAALEQSGSPNRAEVNAALERVQGPVRGVLGRYRQ